LTEFLEAGGELTLDAGGMEANVVECLEVGDIEGEDRGFEAGDTLEPPLKVNEFGDERGLDGVPGGEVGGHALGEGLIFGGVLAGEEDGLRRQSVFEGVLRGGGLAFFGFGTCG